MLEKSLKKLGVNRNVVAPGYSKIAESAHISALPNAQTGCSMWYTGIGRDLAEFTTENSICNCWFKIFIWWLLSQIRYVRNRACVFLSSPHYHLSSLFRVQIHKGMLALSTSLPSLSAFQVLVISSIMMDLILWVKIYFDVDTGLGPVELHGEQAGGTSLRNVSTHCCCHYNRRFGRRACHY